MSSSRRHRSGVIDDIFSLLVDVPIWAGPFVALAIFSFFRWLTPWMLTSSARSESALKMASLTIQLSKTAAPWIGAFVLTLWLIATLKKIFDRQRLDQQTGIASIRGLSWLNFERLLAEAFRRQGFVVDHADEETPDGGVDLRLRRGGEVVLVQCKQWQTWKVGVKVVRELYGVVSAERATRGIVVTSGKFTRDAIKFSETIPITLIGEEELTRMIADVQRTPQALSPAAPLITKLAISRPHCPKCGSLMSVRTAKRGENASSQFWGCSQYPRCNGTRQAT